MTFGKPISGSKIPVGLKIFKTATNGVTKRINGTASILFFTRVSQKGEKRPRFEKIACEPSQGAGTEGQRYVTKIPVRGLKLERQNIFYHLKRMELRYQNPRKGTETSSWRFHQNL